MLTNAQIQHFQDYGYVPVEDFFKADEVQAMLAEGAVQCGFCTPGFVVAAAHLFEANPHPDGLEIKEALAGNVCRCTGYGAILRALNQLAGEDA